MTNLYVTQNQRLNKCIEVWKVAYRNEHLSEEVRRLIRQANFDLCYGPGVDGGGEEEFPYPGFTTACKLIGEALESVPSCLYFDVECECWQEEEPDWMEECPVCEGKGHIPDNEDEMCDTCRGEGAVEAFMWWKVEHKDLMEALVGTELHQYL